MKKLDLPNGAYDLTISEDWMYCRTIDRFFKTDAIQTKEVDESEFNFMKYGYDISPFENGEGVQHLKNGNTLRCFYQSSIVREFSSNGKLIREFPSDWAMMTIYGLALDPKENIWTVEPTVHRIAQFDYTTEQMLFELGGSFEKSGEFDFPEDIVVYDNFLFISDMGHHRIAMLDIENKTVSTYLQFDKPVWEYRRFSNKEYVRLDDGVYEI